MKGQQGGRDCRQRRLPETNLHNCLRKPPIAQFQFQPANADESQRIPGINRPCPGYSGLIPSAQLIIPPHRRCWTDYGSACPVQAGQIYLKTRVNTLKYAYARVGTAGGENKFSSTDTNVVRSGLAMTNKSPSAPWRSLVGMARCAVRAAFRSGAILRVVRTPTAFVPLATTRAGKSQRDFRYHGEMAESRLRDCTIRQACFFKFSRYSIIITYEE
jgi:hypothetical protein